MGFAEKLNAIGLGRIGGHTFPRASTAAVLRSLGRTVMQRRSEHTYALPSSKRQSRNIQSARSSPSNSAPPSPRTGILLPTPSNYGNTVPQPLAYRQRNHSSSSLPTTPPISQQNPVDISHLFSPERLGYQASDWSLLGIERPQVRSKYIITLLYWPTMTLYTWPIDPRKPPTQGTCFITPTGSDNHEANSTTTLRMSLRLLEDCLRTWIRHSRSRSPGGGSGGRMVVNNSELDVITTMLRLATTTEDQREHWLRLQQIPESIPTSTPSSPVQTPSAIPEDTVYSPTESSDSGRYPPRSSSLSPHGRRRTPQTLSPILTPAQGLPSVPRPLSDGILPSAERTQSPTPALSVTEASPIVQNLPQFPSVPDQGAINPQLDQNIDSVIQALSLHDNATPATSAASAVPSVTVTRGSVDSQNQPLTTQSAEAAISAGASNT